jgi:hypothetical protein
VEIVSEVLTEPSLSPVRKEPAIAHVFCGPTSDHGLCGADLSKAAVVMPFEMEECVVCTDLEKTGYCTVCKAIQ